MTCPRCGTEIPAATGRCPLCAEDGATVATGVLTPPASRGGGGEAHTAILDEGVTRVVGGGRAAAGGGPPPDPDDAGTVLPGTVPAADASRHGPLAPGQPFGSRYNIIRALGVGGMGAVYQAWDGELGIAVAMKVILPEVLADPSVAAEVERRFKRELLLARKVTHKNVVRIHDLGQIGGIKYITMTYVDGQDLASVLKREGTLLVPTVLRVARQVVSGLVEAHKAGVVHRDLKPANIMISKTGEALIMDFGIARGVDPGGTTPGTMRAPLTVGQQPELTGGVTQYGAVMGTVEYMAPEQARGEEVDQRADIYALGLMLYDMLVGRKRRAENTENAIAELQARMAQAPPPLKSILPEIPDALDRMIARCVEPDPEKRYQSTQELADDLERLDEHGVPIPIPPRFGKRLIAAAAVGVIALVTGTWWLTRTPPPTQHDPVTVLIADFENSTRDPAFDGTLEQALGTSIEGASFITAYSRDDALRLARTTRVGDRLDETVSRLIAVRQGIKLILKGAVARDGLAYRVTVHVLDPSAESRQVKPLASEFTVARKKEDVLKAVATLAGRLRGELGDTTPESARLGAAETATTASLEALQAFTQASRLKKANRNDEAMAAYQRAVSLDPAFGRAYAGMGDLYMILKDETKAKAAFDEALKHVDRMSEREKYRTYGNYYLNIARNNEKAIESYETFVKLYPADDGGHGNLGLAYLYSGNLAGAIAQVREALRIYPKNALQRYNYAMYSMYATDFDTASAEAARTLKEAPSFSYAFLPIALSAAARGDLARAAETYGKLGESGPEGALQAQLGQADLEMYRGRYRQAVSLLQAGIAAALKDNHRGILAQEYVAVAQAYLALGQRPRAAEAAVKATSYGTHESVLVPAARVLLAVGRVDDANNIATVLEKMLQTQTIAYSRLITAEIALQQGRYVAAIEGFNDSIKRRDTWLARYLRGRAHVETQHFTEAMDDLGRCVTRRGEATDVFVYDTPTLRYLPATYYWLARAQQAMNVADAKKNYEQFLALTAAADPPDPLAADARRRLAAQ